MVLILLENYVDPPIKEGRKHYQEKLSGVYNDTRGIKAFPKVANKGRFN